MRHTISILLCLGLAPAFLASCSDLDPDQGASLPPESSLTPAPDSPSLVPTPPPEVALSECQGTTSSYACLQDAAYGDHPLQSYDLWLPNAQAELAPLVVYVHGGGYFQGDKNTAFNSTLFEPEFFLEAGMAFATVNYRLSGEFPYQKQQEGDYPVMMADVGLALQQIRHQAEALGIDSERVALVGRSAGGGISLWLGLHDDLASGEPNTLRSQSTRPACVALFDTQTTLDIGEVESLLAEDGFSLDDGLANLYGINVAEYALDPEGIKSALAPSFAEASPISHLDASDADLRVILSYGLPFDTGNIHSPEFGDYLANGNPATTAQAFARGSLSSIGIVAPLLVDAPDFAQRRAVERFISEECFQ